MTHTTSVLPADVGKEDRSSDGNIAPFADTVLGQTQSFTYDHRDRLTQAWTTGSASGAYTESYTYDTLGNLTSKAGVSYSYAVQAPWNGGPHAVKSAGSNTYTYDANGNMLTGAGRSYTWTAENQPAIITGADGIPETVTYDGDGLGVKRLVDSGLTYRYNKVVDISHRLSLRG